MLDKDNREAIRKIINAVEYPDNPGRQAALAIQKSREQKQRQLEHVFVLIFRLLFIALLAAILSKSWSDSGTVISRWSSLIFGVVAGAVACLAIEGKKTQRQETWPPSAVFIASVSIIAINLLVSQIKSVIPLSVIASIAIIGSSFLLIISMYALIPYWRVTKK